MDKAIMVKFVGGRQVIGTLKGYDTMLNLVLDECKENLRGRHIYAMSLFVFLSIPPFQIQWVI